MNTEIIRSNTKLKPKTKGSFGSTFLCWYPGQFRTEKAHAENPHGPSILRVWEHAASGFPPRPSPFPRGNWPDLPRSGDIPRVVVSLASPPPPPLPRAASASPAPSRRLRSSFPRLRLRSSFPRLLLCSSLASPPPPSFPHDVVAVSSSSAGTVAFFVGWMPALALALGFLLSTANPLFFLFF